MTTEMIITIVLYAAMLNILFIGLSILQYDEYCLYVFPKDWSLARILSEETTATYTVVLNKEGDVYLGVGDMDIHDRIDPEYVCMI